MSQYTTVLLLGSNLGDTKKNIENAKLQLQRNVGVILTESELLHTKPVEFASKNNFCNIALLIKTQFSPVKLLKSIKKIEQEMGRINDTKITGTYMDRIIDIDIVTYENLHFECGSLRIPHCKHLFERDFSASLLNSLAKKHTQI